MEFLKNLVFLNYVSVIAALIITIFAIFGFICVFFPKKDKTVDLESILQSFKKNSKWNITTEKNQNKKVAHATKGPTTITYKKYVGENGSLVESLEIKTELGDHQDIVSERFVNGEPQNSRKEEKRKALEEIIYYVRSLCA